MSQQIASMTLIAKVFSKSIWKVVFSLMFQSQSNKDKMTVWKVVFSLMINQKAIKIKWLLQLVSSQYVQLNCSLQAYHIRKVDQILRSPTIVANLMLSLIVILFYILPLSHFVCPVWKDKFFKEWNIIYCLIYLLKMYKFSKLSLNKFIKKLN